MRFFLFLALAGALSVSTAHAQGSTADVFQVGTDHVAEVEQTGAGNMADVTQLEQTHYTYLTQSGASSATILQVGDPAYGDHDNCVLLDQSVGATADIEQRGAHNTVWGTGSVIGVEESYQYAHSEASILVVDQTGWSNVLYLDQTDGMATVTQTGHDNASTVVQM